MSPLCSYYDNADNWLGEIYSLSWALKQYSLLHYLHCNVSLTRLQLFQLKHKPIAIEMMYCIEIGHARAVFSAPIKRRSRAADWRRWTGSVHLPGGFSLHLENGFKIEWDHCMACFRLSLMVWCVLNLTGKAEWEQGAKLYLCPPLISLSDPEQDFTKVVTTASQNAAWVRASWELGCANAAAQNSCCLLMSGTAESRSQCSIDPFIPIVRSCRQA